MIVGVADTAQFASMSRLMGELFIQDGSAQPDLQTQANALEMLANNPTHGRPICATDGDQVIGMATLHYTISTAKASYVCRLEDVIVERSYRRHGVGDAIIQFCIDQALSDGCTQMFLRVRPDNANARRFYESHGFYREELVLMARDLNHE